MTTTQTKPKPTTIPKDIHDVPAMREVVDRLMDCRNDITDVNHRLADAMFQPEEYVSPIAREAAARLRGEEYKPESKLETMNQLHHELAVLRTLEKELEREVQRVTYQVAADYESTITARVSAKATEVCAAARKLHEALKSLHSLQEQIYVSGVPFFGNGANRIAVPMDEIERLIRECGEYHNAD